MYVDFNINGLVRGDTVYDIKRGKEVVIIAVDSHGHALVDDDDLWYEIPCGMWRRLEDKKEVIQVEVIGNKIVVGGIVVGTLHEYVSAPRKYVLGGNK